MKATTYLEISPAALAELVSFLEKTESMIGKGTFLSLPEVAGYSEEFYMGDLDRVFRYVMGRGPKEE